MTKIITPSALFSSTSLHSSFLFHESGLDNQLEGRIYSKFSKMVFLSFSAQFPSLLHILGEKKRFHLGINATVPWSVCLSVTSRSCIVLKWQKISARFLFHTTALCLSRTALKFG